MRRPEWGVFPLRRWLSIRSSVEGVPTRFSQGSFVLGPSAGVSCQFDALCHICRCVWAVNVFVQCCILLPRSPWSGLIMTLPADHISASSGGPLRGLGMVDLGEAIGGAIFGVCIAGFCWATGVWTGTLFPVVGNVFHVIRVFLAILLLAARPAAAPLSLNSYRMRAHHENYRSTTRVVQW